MYRAIWRKALADTRSQRMQTALILIILIAASAALALSLNVQQNADEPWRKAFDKANGAHLLFLGGDASVDLSPIADHEGVSAAAGPFPVVWPGALISDGQKFKTRVFGVDAAPPQVGRPVVEDGRWLAAGATTEIVLERSYADHLNIAVGDTVQFKVGDAMVPLTVVGTVLDAGRGSYPDWTPGHAWTLRETIPLLTSDPATIGSALLVRLENPEMLEPFVMAVLSDTPNAMQIGVVDWAEADLTEWNQINSVFLGVFSAFALLAAGFIIANAIGGRVLAQYREIGLLKATGFTPRQVAGIYLIQHLVLAVVGSLLGVGLAVLLAPVYLRQLAETYNTPTGRSFDPVVAAITVVVVLLAVAVFTLLPALRGGRISTIQAITTGFTPIASRPSRLARLAMRLRLPTPVGVGLKDAFARPGRAFLTIASLSLTIVTVTFTLGMEAMFDRLLDDRGLIEEPWDIEVIREDASDAAIRRVLDSNPDIVSYATSIWMLGELAGEHAGELSVDGPGPRSGIELRALGADTEHAGYPMVDGRMFADSGEAIVGRALFDRLGLSLGDQISMDASMDPFDPTGTPERRPLTLTVVGVYIEPEENGNVVLISNETANQLFPGIQPETYEVMMREGGDWDGLITEVHAATGYGVDIDQADRGRPPEMQTIRGIMLGLSALLLIIGVANMLTTTLLNVRERTRDIGILKALGMTPRQVISSVASGVTLLTLLATVIGIPLGLLVYRGLFIVIVEQMLESDPQLYTPPSWFGLTLIVPGALTFAIVSSIIPARRATQVQVTEVLRYE